MNLNLHRTAHVLPTDRDARVRAKEITSAGVDVLCFEERKTVWGFASMWFFDGDGPRVRVSLQTAGRSRRKCVFSARRGRPFAYFRVARHGPTRCDGGASKRVSGARAGADPFSLSKWFLQTGGPAIAPLRGRVALLPFICAGGADLCSRDTQPRMSKRLRRIYAGRLVEKGCGSVALILIVGTRQQRAVEVPLRLRTIPTN